MPVRGNVDTRLALVADGELDAVVLARAGLARLGRLDEVTEIIDPIQMLPAPGQGALAVECRSDEARAPPDLHDLLGVLDDAATRLAVDCRAHIARHSGSRLLGPCRGLRRAADPEPASLSLSCTSGPSSLLSTAPRRCGCPPPDRSTRPHGSVATSRPSCSPKVRLT